jgi:uncharacterized protein YuzE
MVSVTYDPQAKAVYVSLDNRGSRVAKTIPLGGDRYLDVDENGKAVGLEIIFAQDLPQEAVDAIISAEEAIAVLQR